MTVNLSDSKLSGDTAHIQISYKQDVVAAIWHEGFYFLHRWEYEKGRAPIIFDTVTGSISHFNVCRISGVDDV